MLPVVGITSAVLERQKAELLPLEKFRCVCVHVCLTNDSDTRFHAHVSTDERTYN